MIWTFLFVVVLLSKRILALDEPQELTIGLSFHIVSSSLIDPLKYNFYHSAGILQEFEQDEIPAMVAAAIKNIEAEHNGRLKLTDRYVYLDRDNPNVTRSNRTTHPD